MQRGQEGPARSVRNLLTSSGLVAAAAAAGSIATEPQSGWYRRLDKPPWQPPGIAFPIVWSALYADIGATSTAVANELDRRGESDRTRQYQLALARNLFLNALWSWVFFRWHRLGPAAAAAGILALDSVALARRAGQVKPVYGRFLGLYAAWTCFATVLATSVWWRNRDGE